MTRYQVAELLGDGISAELSQSVHAVAEGLPFGIDFHPIDLSLANRDKRGDAVYDEAVEALERLKVAIKYPTATQRESPNKVLRERCGFDIIHRPVVTIPGVENNFTKTLDIDVVRVATGGTYEDRGRRIGAESAVSLRVIERGPCRHAAYFAFKLAMVRKTSVVSTSKYTIQRAADGLFEDTVEAVSRQYPGIAYRRELFDALLAGLILHPERYSVIVCPNEYGDFLSDMACGLIGSIGLGDSASYAMSDDGETELPVGEVGELWARGPMVVKGYWNRPEATAETFVDGWVRTGDLARLDEEGFCFVVDRAKDMLIRGGENIYCVEVENVLYDHPDVMDAALIGLPHRTLGEEPAAVVHLKPGGAATEDELRAFVRERLASFKVPVKVAFWPETLPRNANGKILKAELKSAFEDTAV